MATSERDLDDVAGRLGQVAIEAGRLLAAVSDRETGRVTKDDGSPATAADLASERLILARLRELYPTISAVAEEGRGATGGARAFFLIDPLDGTRDYLNGSDEYAVSIALIEDGRPVAAAIAAPGLGRAWIAGTEALIASLASSAKPDWRPVHARPAPADGLVALVSRRHGDPGTEACLARLPVAERRTLSSAAKFGLLASGEADLYIRCGPTMEWDTAAGDHLVHRAGGAMVGPSGRPLLYGQDAGGFRNGPFAAMGDPALARLIGLPETCCEPAMATTT